MNIEAILNGATSFANSFIPFLLTALAVVTGLYLVPYVYLIVAAGLRGVDPALDEASRVSGATRWKRNRPSQPVPSCPCAASVPIRPVIQSSISSGGTITGIRS